MPCRSDPFTYDHKEHAIGDNDNDNDRDDHPITEHNLDTDESSDDDQPVTVADLLDLYLADDYPSSVTRDVLNRTSDDVYHAVHRIKAAVVTVARLSPEERTEFDRRTT